MMTDKIMVDNIDVSGCPDFDMHDKTTCKIAKLKRGYPVKCTSCGSCNYKQLKRKEEECEKTKKQLEDLQKSYSKLFQRYENKGWSKEYDELEQQLQAEKEKVEELEEENLELRNADNLLNDIYLRILGYYELCDDTPEDLISEILSRLEMSPIPNPENKYKQALEEIKEIVTNYCNACKEFECELTNCMYCNYNKILQKCEVLNDAI